MNSFTLENPVFQSYMIAAAIMILKIMGQGWVTVYRMLKTNAGYASPEDLRAGLINRSPNPKQIEKNDYVDRSRRMHHNDLENIPAFLVCGLLFVATDPSYAIANWLFFGFVGARLLHALAYATAQSHEIRATFYSVGSFIVIGMALYILQFLIL